MERYILGIDNGGTTSKCVIFDHNGNEIAVSGEKIPVSEPKKDG